VSTIKSLSTLIFFFRLNLRKIIMISGGKENYNPRLLEASKRSSKVSSMYMFLAWSDFQRPCNFISLSLDGFFANDFANEVAPPERKLCKPYLDESSPRDCKASLTSSLALVYDKRLVPKKLVRATVQCYTRSTSVAY